MGHNISIQRSYLEWSFGNLKNDIRNRYTIVV